MRSVPKRTGCGYCSGTNVQNRTVPSALTAATYACAVDGRLRHASGSGWLVVTTSPLRAASVSARVTATFTGSTTAVSVTSGPPDDGVMLRRPPDKGVLLVGRAPDHGRAPDYGRAPDQHVAGRRAEHVSAVRRPRSDTTARGDAARSPGDVLDRTAP